MADTESYVDRKNHIISEMNIIEYVKQRFEDVKRSNKFKNMLEFHTSNKYMIMVHDQDELKKLGNIVASHKKYHFQKCY